MSRKLFKRLAAVCVSLIAIAFAGCSMLGGGNATSTESTKQKTQMKAEDFVGTYTSHYENGTENGDLEFTLEIKEDKTYTLTGNEKDEEGSWKSHTVNGEVQLICLPEKRENQVKCEFTLTMLDDGTVMAKSELLLDSSFSLALGGASVDYASAFGRTYTQGGEYSSYYITTVIFKKK